MRAPPSAHGSGLAYSLDLLTVEETELRWEAGHPQTCGPLMALRAHERPYMRSCLEVPFRLVCAQHNLLREYQSEGYKDMATLLAFQSLYTIISGTQGPSENSFRLLSFQKENQDSKQLS